MQPTTIVFTLDPDDTLDYATYYAPFRVATHHPTVNLVLKIEGVRCTFYNSNKVVLQGQKAKTVLEVFFTRYCQSATLLPTASTTKTANLASDITEWTSSDPNPSFPWPSYVQAMIGSDEVGTGDYFGGVVVCAVRLHQEDVPKLKQLGVNDSKKLSDHFIQQIAPQIRQLVEYKLATFWAEEYNAFYQRYQNANMVKTYLHLEAIQALWQPGDFTVVDEFVSQAIWDGYIQKMHLAPVKVDVMIPKAESHYLAVACASVLARDTFLHRMAEQEREWGMTFALGGWNQRVKEAIIQFLSSHPLESLNQVVKLHFKNLAKIIEKV